eukprot:c18933_g1_i1.p1 GENE.c18933_g1_i1~~c18933_g1_i1.p1  ORF type:complete len:644 (-),score=124.72 c18933_g1_i1:59-1990(-)
MTEFVDPLFSIVHLDRISAAEKLEVALKQDPSLGALLQAAFVDLRQREDFEPSIGYFVGCTILAPYVDPDFCDRVLEDCRSCLEHKDGRLREAMGKTVGALCAAQGVRIFEAIHASVTESIKANFTRTSVAPTEVQPEVVEEKGSELVKAGHVTHDTAGWHCLETSMMVLRYSIEGCGPAFAPHVTKPLIAQLHTCTSHKNRFVRETSFLCFASLCQTCDESVVAEFAPELVASLAVGLADNWSQVRYASSVATRRFLEKAVNVRENYFATLLPRMCLNRQYVAEGVKLYSLATWQDVIGTRGRSLLAQYIAPTVEYYTLQARADNHAVREAACHCIAEVAVCVDQQAVSPHVGKLVGALVDAFKDESWPVRDAACLASGEFVKMFPEQCRTVLDELLHLWYEHLTDNIRSVREDSAVALTRAMLAYPGELAAEASHWLEHSLPRVCEQPTESYAMGELQNVTLFGVAAKRQRDNDPKVHTDQQTFSCGSLAPRLKRGGGCMDHGFARDRQPWEYTDGALHFLRELAQTEEGKAVVLDHLPALESVAKARHFAHHVYLQESLWRCVTVVAKSLGLNKFYKFLAVLAPAAVQTLKCGHRLAESSAADCLLALQKLYGKDELLAVLVPTEVEILKSSEFFNTKKK